MDTSKNSNVEGKRQTYCTALQFFLRFINVALIDCRCELAFAPISHGTLVALPLPGAEIGIGPRPLPSDEALMARDWIACSEKPEDGRFRRYLSFPECCQQLDVDAERSRVALLEAIDALADYDNDQAWERLEILKAQELRDDEEALFDAPRVVPAIDQPMLF